MLQHLAGHDLLVLVLGTAAGLACGFLNTMASSGSAVSLPILMMIGLDPVTANATNRMPVLVAAIAATISFHRGGHLDWNLFWRIGLPVTGGAVIGAALAEGLPGRYLALIITAAVLVAFVLLFTQLKQAIDPAETHPVRLGGGEGPMVFRLGIWLGFIGLGRAPHM